MANVNDIMKELAEYIRMGEQIAATVDGLKDQLKRIMQERKHGASHSLKRR